VKVLGRVRWLALLLLCGVAAAETVDKLPAPTSYVSDFAGVMDAASKQQMEQLCLQVDRQAHAQIAVVTVHTLEGVEASEFASDLVKKWGVGTNAKDAKGADRGVLMLFAIDDRKRWVEVGYGLEGVLNDAKVGDIGRSMKPQLEAGAYGPAIEGGLVQIANDIAGDAGVTLTQPQVPAYHYRQQRSGIGVGSLLKILIFFAIVVFIVGRGGGGGGLLWFLAGTMMSGGGRGRDGGFGGGGFGGGGDSGGGGFGGFDGGGSGGGGAGGDW
jgi:uncharacterized protein